MFTRNPKSVTGERTYLEAYLCRLDSPPRGSWAILLVNWMEGSEIEGEACEG